MKVPTIYYFTSHNIAFKLKRFSKQLPDDSLYFQTKIPLIKHLSIKKTALPLPNYKYHYEKQRFN